jgi:purine-binding chemotaxis protein CheW
MAVIEPSGATVPATSGSASEVIAAMGAELDASVLGAVGGDRYLTFRLGSQVYAVPILDVTEILEYRALTGVPMMPAFVRGVLNLRGSVVPVVDLAARFGNQPTEVDRRTGIVIVDVSRRLEQGATGLHIGLLVDAVNKVVHFSRDEIEPAPSFGGGLPSGVVNGMARHEGGFIAVLDVTVALRLDGISLPVPVPRAPGE